MKVPVALAAPVERMTLVIEAMRLAGDFPAQTGREAVQLAKAVGLTLAAGEPDMAERYLDDLTKMMRGFGEGDELPATRRIHAVASAIAANRRFM